MGRSIFTVIARPQDLTWYRCLTWNTVHMENIRLVLFGAGLLISAFFMRTRLSRTACVLLERGWQPVRTFDVTRVALVITILLYLPLAAQLIMRHPETQFFDPITPLVIFGIALSLTKAVRRMREHRRRKARKAPSNVLNMPSRLYEGDSKMLVVKLAGWSDLVQNDEARALLLVDDEGNRLPSGLEIRPNCRPKHLEVELLAAGFEVEGEKRQRCQVSATPMCYQWNICPSASGIYEIGLVFRIEDSSNQTHELGLITHELRVPKIDHLTGRQLWILTGTVGALTGLLGVLEILGRLGIVRLP